MGNICGSFICRICRWICSCFSDYDEFRNERDLLSSELVKSNQEVERLNGAVRYLNSQLDEKKQQIEDTKRQNENDNIDWQRKFKVLEEEKDNMKRKYENEKKQNDDTSRELKRTHKDAEQQRSENGDLMRKLNSSVKEFENFREAAAAERDKYKRELNEKFKQLESLAFKLTTLESENKQLKAELERMQSGHSKEIMYYKEQLESKDRELSEERERTIKSQYKLQEYNMAQQEALEREKEDFKLQTSKKVIDLESKLNQEAEDKLRLADYYQKSKDKMYEENSKTMADLRSTYEKLLREKDQEIKTTRQDIIKMRKEYDSRYEQLEANMKKELEATHARFASTTKGSDEQAELFIKSMYNEFTEVLERQARQLHEAQERERMLRTSKGFYNYTYDEEEDDKTGGVQIEEVFD